MTFLVQGGAPPDDSVSTAKVQDDAITLAKMAGGTDGNLITYDTSGNPAAVATGSSGQVLTSAGAGAAPTFAAGVALEFVSTAAISAATTLVVTSLAAGYDYIIQLEAFGLTDDAELLWMRLSDDNGVSYEAGASDYQWAVSGYGTGARDSADSEIDINTNGRVTGNDAGIFCTLEMVLVNPNASSENTTFQWRSLNLSSDATPAIEVNVGVGFFNQGADAIQAVQFLWSGGSTFKAQGDISVWRRKRS
jgi:hypothetical protein